jgi:hypothetical protein
MRATPLARNPWRLKVEPDSHPVSNLKRPSPPAESGAARVIEAPKQPRPDLHPISPGRVRFREMASSFRTSEAGATIREVTAIWEFALLAWFGSCRVSILTSARGGLDQALRPSRRGRATRRFDGGRSRCGQLCPRRKPYPLSRKANRSTI